MADLPKGYKLVPTDLSGKPLKSSTSLVPTDFNALANNQPAQPAAKPQQVQNTAPTVNPAQLGQQSISNYAQAMGQGGYTQTSEQAGGVFEKAQQEGMANNLALQKDQYNRQQETIAQAQRKNESYAIEQGLGAVKTRPPEGQMQRAEHLDEAFQAMDSMSDHWQAAAKEWNFGGPLKGSMAFPLTSLNQKSYWQSQKLAATSIANGILPYTSGADAKAAVQAQMENDSPNQSDTPQMAAAKMVGLLQKGMNGAMALKRDLQDNNFSTEHIDDVIKTRAPILQKAQDWYNQMNPPANVPQNNGSTFSAEAQQRLNQMSGSPNASTVSSASPSPTPNPPPTPPAQQNPLAGTAPQGLGTSF